MTDEQLLEWLFLNFKIQPDVDYYERSGRFDVIMIPKTDIAEMLDDEFNSSIPMYVDGDIKSGICWPIFEYLEKFHNIRQIDVNIVLQQLYDQIYLDFHK